MREAGEDWPSIGESDSMMIEGDRLGRGVVGAEEKRCASLWSAEEGCFGKTMGKSEKEGEVPYGDEVDRSPLQPLLSVFSSLSLLGCGITPCTTVRDPVPALPVVLPSAGEQTFGRCGAFLVRMVRLLRATCPGWSRSCPMPPMHDHLVRPHLLIAAGIVHCLRSSSPEE